jgi:hypothetical protein
VSRPEVIETDIPARLDRLPWSRFRWRIVLGLGTVWVLDGVQVTIVGAIAPRMPEPSSGIDITAAGVGLVGAPMSPERVSARTGPDAVTGGGQRLGDRLERGPLQAGASYTAHHENGGPRESQAVG